MYRADPLKALASYGIEKISFDELVSEETVRVFGSLPGNTLEDANAFSKILEFLAKGQ